MMYHLAGSAVGGSIDAILIRLSRTAASPARLTGGFYYGWVITAAYFLVMGVAWGTVQGFGVFVTPVADGMGWSRAGISVAASIMVITNSVTGVCWGLLSDRWSTKGVIAVSGALLGLGFFLTGTVGSLWQFYLFLGVVAGAGLGGTTSPMASITARWFERRRGLATGIGFAGMGLGSAVLPVLVTIVIALQGWRFGFQILGYIIWGTFLIAALLLKEPRRGKSDAPDSEAAPSEGSGVEGSSAASQPSMTLPESIRTRTFWLIFGTKVAAFLTLMMVVVHLVPRATDAGLSSQSAVVLITVMAMCSFGGMLVGGGLGDRLGAHKVLACSLLLQALALLWLSASSSLWQLYVFAAAFGIGYGGWSPQFPAIAARAFGTRHMGSVFGTLLVGAGTGATIGPVMAGAIFDSFESYRIAFILGSGLAFAGAVMAWFLKEGTPTSRRRPAAQASKGYSAPRRG